MIIILRWISAYIFLISWRYFLVGWISVVIAHIIQLFWGVLHTLLECKGIPRQTAQGRCKNYVLTWRQAMREVRVPECILTCPVNMVGQALFPHALLSHQLSCGTENWGLWVLLASIFCIWRVLWNLARFLLGELLCDLVFAQTIHEGNSPGKTRRSWAFVSHSGRAIIIIIIVSRENSLSNSVSLSAKWGSYSWLPCFLMLLPETDWLMCLSNMCSWPTIESGQYRKEGGRRFPTGVWGLVGLLMTLFISELIWVIEFNFPMHLQLQNGNGRST